MKINIIWKFHFYTKLILDTLKQPGQLVMCTKNSQNDDTVPWQQQSFCSSSSLYRWITMIIDIRYNIVLYCIVWFDQKKWQDLHDDNKTCMQSSYWELILENGQWLRCWITDGLCALPVTGWTGIHGFGYLSSLIQIAPFSVHKLIRQDTAVLHQAIIV
jgi:hypothetical protein